MTKSCTCHQTPTPSYSQIGKPKESSVIGEILALAARPEVISFAGGLPSAEGFPVKAIKDAAHWVLETCPQVALQYSRSHDRLRLPAGPRHDRPRLHRRG